MPVRPPGARTSTRMAIGKGRSTDPEPIPPIPASLISGRLFERPLAKDGHPGVLCGDQ